MTAPQTALRLATLPVFVYGTLRRGRGNYHRFLAMKTASERPGVVRGAALYNPAPFPFATITDDPDDFIIGEVMTPKADIHEAVMRRLDALEGYQPDGDGLYDRKVVTVDVGGETMQAWMYCVPQDTVEFMQRISTGDFLNQE